MRRQYLQAVETAFTLEMYLKAFWTRIYLRSPRVDLGFPVRGVTIPKRVAPTPKCLQKLHQIEEKNCP